MTLRYVTTNLLASASDLTLTPSSLNGAPWNSIENLYCGRPSLPFRFGGIGAVPTPEWLCIDFGAATAVTFCGIFNHNLTYLPSTGGLLHLSSCTADCVAGACAGACTLDLDATRMLQHSRNTYGFVTCAAAQWWLLEVADPTNTDGFIELGELVLGRWQEFSSGVHVQPGRPDSPVYHRGTIETHYGQLWPSYYSEAQEFELRLKNVKDAATVDELHTFLSAVQQAGGQFIYIPDHRQLFCYYVMVLNHESMRLVYGEGELREWRMKLRTLAEGVSLL